MMKQVFTDKLIHNVPALSHITAITVIMMISAACSTANPAHSGKITIPGLQDSLLTDREGNRYPVKLFPDNNLWMTANLDLHIPNSYCYNDKEDSCKKYGCLYTYDAARDGCALLGEGWRLPAVDEWKRLAVSYSSQPQDSVETGKSAYKAFINPGDAQFNVLLSGQRDPGGRYSHAGAHGFFWTATETGSNTAWLCNFGKGLQFLTTTTTLKKQGRFLFAV